MSVLQGKIFITTCADDKAAKLRMLFESKGAEVHNFPFIEIQAASNNLEKIENAFSLLNTLDWLIFTSTNGVNYFFYWLNKLEITKSFSHLKIAAIGKATADELKKADLVTDYISQSKDSTEFAKELLEILPDNQKILLPTGNLAPDKLMVTLNQKHNCQKLVVYNTTNTDSDNKELWKRVNANTYDLILFLSPSAVNGFMSKIDKKDDVQLLKCGAIGATTKQALMEKGVNPFVVPTVPDIEHLILDIEEYFKKINKNNI